MIMLKNQYQRVAADNSQLQEFTNQVCDAFENGDGEFKKIPDSDKTPVVYTIIDDFDKIPSELLAKLKIGDIIYSTGQGSSCYVDDLIPDYNMYLSSLVEGEYYHYIFESEEWQFSNTISFVIEKVNNAISDGDIDVGTKLYRHEIEMTDGSTTLHFYIISNKSSAYILSDFDGAIYMGVDYISASPEKDNDSWGYAPVVLQYVIESLTFSVNNDAVNGIAVEITFTEEPTVTDTVTKL